VAELASAAAQRCRIDPAGTTTLRRTALVHDLGRVAIGAGIWQKPGPLNADEWEQVRLHAYHTERVLSRSPFLSAPAPVAGAHHERIDGSGYHRGASGAELTLLARVLAAADAYHAMTEPRAHRAPTPRSRLRRSSPERPGPDGSTPTQSRRSSRPPDNERPRSSARRG
jgi:HD-GYP domain-containing protein (c-di-GMP phosphodiesterase class II)